MSTGARRASKMFFFEFYAAPKPWSPVSHHRPHTSTPCQDHHTRRARGHGTTNTTTTPPFLPTPTP